MTSQIDDPYDDANEIPTDSMLTQDGYPNRRPGGRTLALHPGVEEEDPLGEEDIPPE